MILHFLAEDEASTVLLGYRPPVYQYWEAGAWERDSWGSNDEYGSPPAPPPEVPVGDAQYVYYFTRMRRR